MVFSTRFSMANVKFNMQREKCTIKTSTLNFFEIHTLLLNIKMHSLKLPTTQGEICRTSQWLWSWMGGV